MINLPWRKNVLALVGLAYATLIIVFVSLAWSAGLSVKDAYDLIEGPLMAVIGGTLALAKDLVDDPSDHLPTAPAGANTPASTNPPTATEGTDEPESEKATPEVTDTSDQHGDRQAGQHDRR